MEGNDENEIPTHKDLGNFPAAQRVSLIMRGNFVGKPAPKHTLHKSKIL